MAKKRKGQERIGIVLTYVNIVINFLIGILYTPFMTATLGKAEYGLYSQIGALINYMSVADFGLHSTITRYVAKYRVNKDDEGQKLFLSDCLWFYLAVTVLLTIVGIILCSNIKIFINNNTSAELFEKAQIMSVLLVVNISLSLPLGMYASILEGYGDFGITNAIKIAAIVIRTGVLIGVLTMGAGSIGIVIVDTVFTILRPLIYALIARFRHKVKIRLFKFSWSRTKELLKFSVYIFILALVNQFFWKLGQVALGKIVGTEASAEYGLSVQIISYIEPLTLAISGVFLPRITRFAYGEKDSNEKINYLFKKIGKYQALLITLVFIGFIFYGQQFVHLWVGDDYKNAYYLITILIAAIWTQSIMTVGTSTLKAIGKHKYQAFIYLGSALVNVGVGILFAHFYGAIGMAIGTLIAILFVQTPLMIVVFVKHAKLKMGAFYLNVFKSIALPVIGSSVFMYIANYYVSINSWIKFFALVLISSIVYLILAFFFALDSDERREMVRILTKPYFKLRKRTTEEMYENSTD